MCAKRNPMNADTDITAVLLDLSVVEFYNHLCV